MLSMTLLTTALFAHAILHAGDLGPATTANRIGPEKPVLSGR